MNWTSWVIAAGAQAIRSLPLLLVAGAATATGPPQPPAALLEFDHGPLLAEVESRLDSRDKADWREAWRTAERIGPPLAGALWAKLHRDPNPRRRLVRIGAFAAAAGGDGAEQLLEESWWRVAKPPERLMALLVLALGPPPAEASSVLRSRVDALPSSPALRLAAALALVRRPAGIDALPHRWYVAHGDDPDAGLCAAALLLGVVPPDRVLEPWFSGAGIPTLEAQLVWRALLLCPTSPQLDDSVRAARARTALRWSGPASRPSRWAASLCLGRLGDATAWSAEGAGPPPDELVRFAYAPAGRALALQRRWLAPVPPVLADASLRSSLAVQFVLSAPPSAIAAAAPEWRAAELRDAVCLALAWRALAEPGVLTGSWIGELAQSATFPWLAVAIADAGDPPPVVEPGSELALAVQRRLPAAAMARDIERELWRQHAHPGAVAWQCWTELVRDLLLSGSDYARALDARQDAFPYLPVDLQPGDELFEPACEFFAWREAERATVPLDVRLR